LQQRGRGDGAGARFLRPHRRQMRFAAGGRTIKGHRRGWPGRPGIEKRDSLLVSGHHDEIITARSAAHLKRQDELGHKGTRLPAKSPRSITAAYAAAASRVKKAQTTASARVRRG